MNTTKFRELLAGKIDSLERWREVCSLAHVDPISFVHASNVPIFHYASLRYICGPMYTDDLADSWWLRREQWRQELGVYPARSEVMQAVITNAKLDAYCIHISREDPQLVAYTPSNEDGKRDKQVRLSFGKLLRKLLLLATDTHIQQLEAYHRSEMDPTFLVARTPEEIRRVYTQMDGDSGCMRYPARTWNLPDDLHPSTAYSYAGLAVAYTEIDGVIKSRCVIYDNPDDPKDKRWVRIYGDGALRRKLEAAGYTMGNLAGAKLRKIDLRTINNAEAQGGDEVDFQALLALGRYPDSPFVVPYLDGPGGAQGTEDGSYGYVLAGEDCIRLITGEQRKRLVSLGFSPPQLKSTGVRFNVPEVDPAALQFTCPITGGQHNALEVTTVTVWHDGQVKTAVATDEVRARFRSSAYTVNAGAVKAQVAIDPDATQTFYSTSMRPYVDNDANRAANGFVRLDATFYPDAPWAKLNTTRKMASGGYVRREDTFMLFDAVGDGRWCHVSEMPPPRKSKDYVSVAPKGDVKGMSHRSNPRLVMTLGKRRCVQDYHAIVRLANGTWDYQQNVHSRRFMDTQFYISCKAPHALPTAEVVREEVRGYVLAEDYDGEDFAYQMRKNLTMRLRHGVNDQFFFMRGDMPMRGASWGSEVTLDEIKAAAVRISAMSDQELADTVGTYAHAARTWATVAAHFINAFEAEIAERQQPITPQEVEAAVQPQATTQIDPLDDALVSAADALRTDTTIAA